MSHRINREYRSIHHCPGLRAGTGNYHASVPTRYVAMTGIAAVIA